MTNEMEENRVTVSQFHNYRLITLSNMEQIDLYNEKEIQEVFQKGNAEGIEDWIIDLSKINHIDSSGLGGLANQGILLSKKSKRLNILSPKSGVKHLFSVGGFNKMFAVIQDKSDLL